MTCPRCYAEFVQGLGSCPECGVQLLRNVSGVMKTSTVMIAAGSGHEFYRSVQDVPQPLRARLLEVTNSANSGTIVIADRAGKEQLSLGTGRRETPGDPAVSRLSMPGHAAWFWSPRFLPWVAALLLLVAAAVIAAAFLAR
ncbi:MAG: hypothetical protein M3N54_04330 [Acidobacteriota bacterium]|nr:hypothetical protein [Acidobacteriota bacterium]